MAENFTPNQIITFTNDTSAVNAVNGNFTAIASLFNDVLSRGGVSPNQMNSALDMNSNQILNLPPPSTSNSPARLIDVIGQAGTLTVPPTGTSGAVVGFLNGNNTYSGISTFTNSVNIIPTAGTTNQGLSITQSPSGTVTALQYAFNNITLTSDNVANTFGTTFPLVDALLVKHNFGGSSFIGTAQALEVNLNMTATTSALQPSRDYVGIEVISVASANDTGTSPSPQGAIFGLGAQAILQNGATFWENVTGAELNVAVNAGASAAIKTGLQIAVNPTDAVQGSLIDAAIWLQAQVGVPGWKNGFLIGGTGTTPIASTGTIMATTGNTTVANGIDFTSYTFTGNAIHTPGFQVLGTGALTISRTDNSAPQLILNNTGQFSQVAFQNSSASKAVVQWDNVNNFFEFVALGSASLVFQSNGINALLIGPTGSLLLGAVNSWTPNGTSAAVTLTAVTPAAVTSTIVHEWLTIVDSSGQTVYIPCWH